MNDVVQYVVRGFRSRPLDGLLIVVAIALGVAVLTAVGALLDANARSWAAFEESVGAREIILRPQGEAPFVGAAGADASDVRAVGSIYSGDVRFTPDDLAAVRDATQGTVDVYVRGFRSFATDAWDGFLPATSVNAGYLDAARIRVVEGSLPTISDFDEERNVIVMTPRFTRMLGLEGDPIGQQVVFTGEEAPFTLVGLLPDTPASPVSMREALVPFRLGREPIGAIHAVVSDSDHLDRTLEQLSLFADARWDGLVSVTTNREQSRSFLVAQQGRVWLIAAFAATSLAVASLNVMGLMLAMVTRRTREISIARSLGATRSRVAATLLSEAAAYGLLGGILGAASGYGLLQLYNDALARASGTFQIQIPYSFAAAGVGAALAIALCLAATLYPALRAMNVRIAQGLGGS